MEHGPFVDVDHIPINQWWLSSSYARLSECLRPPSCKLLCIPIPYKPQTIVPLLGYVRFVSWYSLSGWWFQSLWKIWKSMGKIIRYMMEKKTCFKPPSSYIPIPDSVITFCVVAGRFLEKTSWMGLKIGQSICYSPNYGNMFWDIVVEIYTGIYSNVNNNIMDGLAWK